MCHTATNQTGEGTGLGRRHVMSSCRLPLAQHRGDTRTRRVFLRAGYSAAIGAEIP